MPTLEIMNKDQEYQAVLTETLRKIGRNLLNYQIVEKIWKAQLKIANVETRLESGQMINISKPEPSRNIPMGWLSENHRKSLFSSFKEESTNKHIETFSIKTSFRVGENGSLSKLRQEQIVRLVQERNELVHSISEKFDHTSSNSCLELCTKLDEQNIRILEEIRFLNEISVGYKEAIVEIQKYIESDEFMRELEQRF